MSKKGLSLADGSVAYANFLFCGDPDGDKCILFEVDFGISRTFRDKEARQALLDAKDEDALWKVLMKLTQKTFQGVV